MVPPTGSPSRRRFLAAALGTAGAGGVASAKGTTTTTADDVPETRWEFAPSDVDSFLPSVVDGGTLFTVGQSASDGAAADERRRSTLYALDVDDGTEAWNGVLGEWAHVPAVGDDLVYINSIDQTGRRRGRSMLHAFDAEDGTEAWANRYENGYVGMPSLVDGTLYAANGGTLLALDPGTGSEDWQYRLDSSLTNAPFVDFPVRLDDRLFVGTSRGVHAVDSTDGTSLWRAREAEQRMRYPIGVDEEHVYVWARENIHARRVDDGTVEWERQVAPNHYHVGAIDDGTWYTWDDGLVALDAKTGNERWRLDTGGGGTVPIFEGGVLYSITGTGTFSAVSVERGKERWEVDLGSDGAINAYGLWGDVMDGTAYVATPDGVHALSTEDGTRRWTFVPEKGEVTWTEVTEETIFVGTHGGGLYALDRDRPFLAALVDGTTDFLTSGPGLAFAGTVVGAGVLAARKRWSEGAGPMDETERDPELEFGRIEPLGSGPFTETHRVRKRTADGPREVVEKRFVPPERADAPPEGGGGSSDRAGAFLAAVERWSDLDRKGVVPVLDRGDDPVPWVELPYYEGGSLADSERPLGERVLALSEAATTVHRAHRDGLVHGGLSPANVLLDSDGNAAVDDWELAAALAEGRDPTPYDAPEQVAGDAADERTDVYRLGAVAHFVLTGEEPAGPPTAPTEADPSLPDELDDVLRRATAADPAERYDSALEFDDVLRWAAFRA